MFVETTRITGQRIAFRADDVIAITKEGERERVSLLLRASDGEWISLRDDFDSLVDRIRESFYAL